MPDVCSIGSLGKWGGVGGANIPSNYRRYSFTLVACCNAPSTGLQPVYDMYVHIEVGKYRISEKYYLHHHFTRTVSRISKRQFEEIPPMYFFVYIIYNVDKVYVLTNCET